MKNYNKIFAALLAGSLLASCNDLDVQPVGSTITADQREEVNILDPTKAEAAITGITGMTYLCAGVTGDESNHDDFGWPSCMLGTDMRGQDMYSIASGYNHFYTYEALSDAPEAGTGNAIMFWDNYYNIIRACNSALETILATIDEDDTEGDYNLPKFYAAQALSFRAYSYFMLAQTFQKPYAIAKDEVCAPLITEENSDAAAKDGCAPATVAELYAQVENDLNKAIGYLANNTYTPEKVLSTKPRRFVSLAAAYGIRARVNLVKEDWTAAASDAQAAIDNFSGAPLSMAEASVPGFNSLEANNWMWGIACSESDRVVTSGIINFPSHMGSFSYGYASAVGAWKWINNTLLQQVPYSDVRYGWWLDENGTSANLTEAQQEFVSSCGADYAVQVKFAPYQGSLNTSVNASDIPLMRIEEMYLILAEAKGMTSPSDGADLLTQFVSTYRDPKYSCSAASAEDLQDAVWFQRRIELWGEGFSYYDMLRLQKGLDRREGGWPAAFVYDIPANDNVLFYPTPQSETQTNRLFTEGTKLGGSMPTPVSSL